MISGLWPKIFLKDFHIRFLAFRLQKNQLEYFELLTQEIKKGDKMNKDKLISGLRPKIFLKDFHIRFLAMGNTKRSRLSRSDDFLA